VGVVRSFEVRASHLTATKLTVIRLLAKHLANEQAAASVAVDRIMNI
jgi:hypothetical protein